MKAADLECLAVPYAQSKDFDVSRSDACIWDSNIATAEYGVDISKWMRSTWRTTDLRSISCGKKEVEKEDKIVHAMCR